MYATFVWLETFLTCYNIHLVLSGERLYELEDFLSRVIEVGINNLFLKDWYESMWVDSMKTSRCQFPKKGKCKTEDFCELHYL